MIYRLKGADIMLESTKTEVTKVEKPKLYINNIRFNDDTILSLESNSIVVFTGANNTGKSQVLKDIDLWLTKKSTTVVAKEFEIKQIVEKGQLSDWIKSVFKPDANGKYIKLGSLQDLELYWSCPLDKNQNTGLNDLSRLFINTLNTEERLLRAKPPKSFDTISQEPSHPIQVAYADDDVEKTISKYFKEAFGEDLIIDKGAGSEIPLFVGEKPELIDVEDRTSKSYRKRLHEKAVLLHQQGDGMRSFAAILLDTFASKHSITLVDEPEAFLHPPQAKALGKMLANNTPNDSQLFISTHSADFLNGLLEAENTRVKIVRINRDKNVNHMNVLESAAIKELWNNPLLRYSNILNGLFHSKVVVCESDADCRFYQAILNTITDDPSVAQDIHFCHCGGKSRLAIVANALKAVNVKTVIIADIDILRNSSEDLPVFKNTCSTLGIDFNNIKSNYNVLNDYVKQQRPQLDLADVKKEINAIFEKIDKKETQLPKNVADEIAKAVRQTSAWSKVKNTGMAFFSGESYNAYNSLLTMCKENGLFIVPVGELESFYKSINGHGPQWVIDVLEQVTNLKNVPELRAAREFVQEIVDF
jgi:predicted ATPase